MLGLIGAGGIGAVHARSIANTKGTLCGIFDKSEGSAGLIASEYGGKIFNSYEELLNCRDILGVVVATPNVFHVEHAIKALDLGKHVLLEKPASISFEESKQLLSHPLAETHLFLGLVCREAESVRRVKNKIDQGDLGDIFHIQMTLTRFRGIPGLGKWFTNYKKSGGGVLIDLGVHILDAAWYLSDYPCPSRVTGQVRSDFGSDVSEYQFKEMWAGPPDLKGVFDVEDSARAFFRHPGGRTSSLELAWSTNVSTDLQPHNIIVHGTKGSASFDLLGSSIKWCKEVKGSPSIKEESWESDSDMVKEPFARQMINFMSLVKREVQTPKVRVYEIEQSCSVIDSVYRSSQLGEEVSIIAPSATRS